MGREGEGAGGLAAWPRWTKGTRSCVPVTCKGGHCPRGDTFLSLGIREPLTTGPPTAHRSKKGCRPWVQILLQGPHLCPLCQPKEPLPVVCTAF